MPFDHSESGGFIVKIANRPLQSYAIRIALALAAIPLAIYPRQAFSLANCGTVTKLTIDAGPAGCDVQFGLMNMYDNGRQTSVALISTNLLLEVHRSQNNSGMWYHVGKLNGMTVTWGDSHDIDNNGDWPTVAVSNSGYVIFVHSTKGSRSGSRLDYRVGKLDPNGDQNQLVTWLTGDAQWDAGYHSSISMNNSGVIVGVHESSSSSGLYYRVGHLTNPAGGNYTITWDSGTNGVIYSHGENPHIALNNNGQVVEVHQVSGEHLLHYIRGMVSGGKIGFASDQPVYSNRGQRPSVALNDNGFVTEVHGVGSDLERTVGKLNSDGATIDWSSMFTFGPEGTYPAIAANGSSVVLSAENGPRLIFTVSAIRDRSNWMGDMLPSIGTKTLGDIVVPGSHDAGMYCGGGNLGQTQDHNLYEQLQDGVRFFDLRVTDGDPQLIYHGRLSNKIPIPIATCESVGKVMGDVKKFMTEGHNEVVVLKFSHFLDFGNCKTTGEYIRLKKSITDNLSTWMYKGDTRPTDVALNNLSSGGKVVVVVDGDWAAPTCNHEESGFYIYKDSCTNEDNCKNPVPASDGEFNVFDKYSNTTTYETMRDDQLTKYAEYTGKMVGDPSVADDLFLLSWTLTPGGIDVAKPVSVISIPANIHLGEEMSNLTKNTNGFIPNILYVDYIERARVTDTAVMMTQRFNP
jgi:hypothetical protein